MVCKEYNEKVDIWSIGIALYYMLSGEYPFADGDPAKLKFSILNGRYHFKRKPLSITNDRTHLGRALPPLQGLHHGAAHD
jgi:serine/threonine protein kinase